MFSAIVNRKAFSAALKALSAGIGKGRQANYHPYLAAVHIVGGDKGIIMRTSDLTIQLTHQFRAGEVYEPGEIVVSLADLASAIPADAGDTVMLVTIAPPPRECTGTARFTLAELKAEWADARNLADMVADHKNQVQHAANNGCAVPPAVLAEYPGITITPPAPVLQVVADDSTATIETLQPDKFPARGGAVEDAPALDSVTMEYAELLRALDGTSYAMAKESTRYALNGVLLTLNGRCQAVATDGRRLATEIRPVLKTAAVEFASLLPFTAVIALGKLAKGDKDTRKAQVKIDRIETDRLRFTIGDDWEIVTVLVAGQFPPFNDVIPKGNHITLTADGPALLAMIQRAGKGMSEDCGGLGMECIPGRGVRFFVGESFNAQFPCKVEGGDITIGFNPVFLADAVKHATRGSFEDVSISFDTPGRPCLVRPYGAESEHSAVVMPVNLA